MEDLGSSPVITGESAAVNQAHHLPIEFTGSGSEYFRIWIVNLLLMLVTVGIYYPWAKVRRLRYFHANTLVGGEPLGFHAAPNKMLKGYFLVGVMFTLYSVAGKLSALAGFLAFAMVAAIWPGLIKSSMQFRLANTSWRGLHFRFEGSLTGAYQAMMPMFIPALIAVAAAVGVENPNKPPLWYAAVLGFVVVASFAVFPWLLWNLKQYQHNHYALASLRTTFKAKLGDFYLLFFKTLGIALIVMAVILTVFALLMLKSGNSPLGLIAPAMIGTLALIVFFSGVIALTVVKPYFTAHLQNLVWTQTGNSTLRFVSDLRASSLVWLATKNWLLVMVTVGFYWPFAAIAVARLRVQAVAVKTRLDPQLLVSQILSAQGEAAGDAAGDVFGVDIGL